MFVCMQLEGVGDTSGADAYLRAYNDKLASRDSLKHIPEGLLDGLRAQPELHAYCPFPYAPAEGGDLMRALKERDGAHGKLQAACFCARELLVWQVRLLYVCCFWNNTQQFDRCCVHRATARESACGRCASRLAISCLLSWHTAWPWRTLYLCMRVASTLCVYLHARCV